MVCHPGIACTRLTDLQLVPVLKETGVLVWFLVYEKGHSTKDTIS